MTNERMSVEVDEYKRFYLTTPGDSDTAKIYRKRLIKVMEWLGTARLNAETYERLAAKKEGENRKLKTEILIMKRDFSDFLSAADELLTSLEGTKEGDALETRNLRNISNTFRLIEELSHGE